MPIKLTTLNNKAIQQFQADLTVNAIRDKNDSLIFRYSSINRAKGYFYARTYINGKDKFTKLGSYPMVSAQTAHQALKQVHHQNAFINHNTFNTMNELCDWYINRLNNDSDLKVKTKKQTTAMIVNHIKPLLGAYRLREINHALIDAEFVQVIRRKLALSTVTLLLTVLNGMIKRAKALGLISKNSQIASDISISKYTRKRATPKLTRLNKQLFLKIPKLQANQKKSHQMIILMLITFATRAGETASAKWQDFDFENLLWRIPGSETKNGKPHTLPLPERFVLQLKKYKAYQWRTRRSSYLFPQASNARKPISGNALSRLVSDFSKKMWSAHDLRKYARSWWLDNGIDYLIGELLLNHTLSKLDQTYIQTYALIQCRTALNKWFEYLKVCQFKFNENCRKK